MERYDILTLNARALMNFSGNKNGHPEYRIDLRDRQEAANFSVISSTEEMGDTPFFHQVLECSGRKPLKSEHYDRSRLLYEDVIFVDFKDSLLFLNKRHILSEIKKLKNKDACLNGKRRFPRTKIAKKLTFQRKILNNNPEIRKGNFKYIPESLQPKAVQRSEIIRGFTIAEHFYTLLNSNFGITIVYEDGKEIRFVPSDRSSSMAKASKLAYINAKYLDEMGRRICLDMGFSKIGAKSGGIQLSKYYAYRGLYLTTSERIDFDTESTPEKNNIKKERVINKESLIVLKDFKANPCDSEGKTFFTAKKKAGSSRHDFFLQEKYEGGELNLYDGEGFICPELTDRINQNLWISREGDREIYERDFSEYKTLTSIQIRGPFLKGMLHTVDFVSFFKEYGKLKDGKLMVKDAFGKERDLLKAKIIVNESMFKCAAWLREYCGENKNTDPMDSYFSSYNEYNHGLYVANAVNDTDEDQESDWDDETKSDEKELKDIGIESLNYQFLSTLCLEGDELETLVNDHLENTRRDLKEKYGFEEESAHRSRTNLPVYLEAVKLNPRFQKTKIVKDGLYRELRRSRRLIGCGKLKTTGEHRYLSSDLLAYLEDILSRTDFGVPDSLKNEKLDKHYFFAPAKPDTKGFETDTAFERNPHLSRQEEVVLKPFNPEKGSLYTRFGLNKLTDIVMFPRATLNFMILSSADMDGDMVMMYSSETIVDAIKRGCYDENLDRTVPIILIPDEGKKLSMATKEGNPDIALLIENFSNQVGKISNMAVTFAREEYGTSDHCLVDNPTARCTILTGLEIDKVKHGYSVAGDIRELNEKCSDLKGNKQKDYFIERKEKLTGFGAENCKVEKGKNGFVLMKGDNDYLSVGIKPLSETSFPLDKLMAYYGEKECNSANQDKSDAKDIFLSNPKIINKYPYYFDFQKNENWEDLLEKEKKGKIEALIGAYNLATKYFRNIHLSLAISESTNFHGKALYYLRKRYDGSDFSFKPEYSDKTVEMLLVEAETLVEDKMLDSKSPYQKIYHAVSELVDHYKWPFITDPDERERVLKKLLGNDIPKDILAFMTDFREEGYYLTYFVFKYVFYKLRAQRPVSEMISMKDRAELEKKGYWNSLYEILDKAISDKYSSSKFHSKISSKCRLLLDKIFPEDDSSPAALPYVFALSGENLKDADFLWNVIPSETILENVYLTQTEEEEC